MMHAHDSGLFLAEYPISPLLKPTRSVLHIGTCITIESVDLPPNPWWRFWYWLLLGWRWERK